MVFGCSIENLQSKIFNGSPLSCRWRSDWRPAIPALQTAASVTAGFTSNFTDRPAVKNASCSGQLPQLELTCGGYRRYLFVGCVHVAACSARWHSRIRNTESRIPSLTPTKLNTSTNRCGGDRRHLFVGCITVAACSTRRNT